MRSADRIVVLNNGGIEVCGTHEELLQDSKTYQDIQDAMQSVMKNRTGIIAHRLSTIRDADIIVVMDKGRIVKGKILKKYGGNIYD